MEGTEFAGSDLEVLLFWNVLAWDTVGRKRSGPAPTAQPWAAGASPKAALWFQGWQRWGDFVDPYIAAPLIPPLNGLQGCQKPLPPSPAKGDGHLQLACPVHLHHSCPQLPLVSGRQEALGVSGDSKNVPEP